MYIYIYTHIIIYLCVNHCTAPWTASAPPLICCRIPPEDYGSETTTVRWGKATYIHSSSGAVRLIFKVFGEMIYNLIWLVVSTYPSEKYEFVSWDDYSQYIENKKCSKPPTSITSHKIWGHHLNGPWCYGLENN